MNNKKNKQKEQSFKEVLADIESPEDIGNGSWALPANPTVSQQIKYGICQKIIHYKRNKKITTEQLARQVNSQMAEMNNILHCRLTYLDLNNLTTYANTLFAPCRVEFVFRGKHVHAPAFSTNH